MNRHNFCNVTLDTVVDGLQALEANKAKNNAVLITDCHMPKRDDSLPKPLDMPQLRMAYKKWLPHAVPISIENNPESEDDWKAIDDKMPLPDGLIVELESYINRL